LSKGGRGVVKRFLAKVTAININAVDTVILAVICG
jgi:hypothetical protein